MLINYLKKYKKTKLNKKVIIKKKNNIISSVVIILNYIFNVIKAENKFFKKP